MEGDDELAELKRRLGQGQYTDMAPQAWKDANMGRVGGPTMADRVPPPRGKILKDQTLTNEVKNTKEML